MTTPQSDLGRGAARSAEGSSGALPSVPECQDEVCITCSDLAVAVRIVALHGNGLALVDTGEGIEEVSVALVQAAVGDTVLVHAKEAITVVAPS